MPLVLSEDYNLLKKLKKNICFSFIFTGKINPMTSIYTIVFVLMQLVSISGEKETSVYSPAEDKNYVQILYDQINDPELNIEALAQAIKGYSLMRHRNITSGNRVLTIIDYSLPSNSRRFFVIDVSKGSILFKSLVAHGRNSGANYAVSFSNKKGSHKSSIGFFITGETYHGKHGLSLRLNGLERNINDNAMERAVVIHAASYVDEEFIKRHGRLGRSYGCPALPIENYESIVNIIRNKTCVFIYYPDSDYLAESEIINCLSCIYR